jgi:hypothetical protein
MKRLACAPVLFFAVACGGSDDDPAPTETPPPPPANGIQIALPEIEVAPSEEKQTCWYTTFDSDEPVWLSGYRAFQGKIGHHIIAFQTLENVPDGTLVDCTSGAAMATWLPLLLAQEVTGLELPAGYGIRIPARAKLVFQMHYVNPSSSPVIARDYVNLNFADDQVNITGAAPFANSVLELDVPPEESTLKYRCTVPQQMNVFSVLGHMHEHGVAFSVSAGAPGAQEIIYDYPVWDGPGFRDTPPVKTWPLESPLVLNAGDLVDVSCTWNNPTGSALGFPQEMCASLLWFYPAEGTLVCGGEVM